MSGCTIEVHRSSNVLRRGCLKPVHAMISSQPQSQRVSPATRYPSGLAYHPWSQVIELESVSCFKHKRMRLTKKRFFPTDTREISLWVQNSARLPVRGWSAANTWPPDSLSGTRSLNPLILSGQVFQAWARPHPGLYLPAITH